MIITTSATASISSNCTSRTDARMVTVRSVSITTSTAAGSDAESCGSRRLMRSTTSMTLAPGWRWMLTMTAADSLAHAARRVFSAPSIDVGDVDEPHRRAVAVGDDHGLEFVGRLQLVVGVDGRRARRTVEAALRLIRIGVADRGAQIVEREVVRGERLRIRLDAHRRTLAAADADEPDAGQLGDLGREPRVGQILDLRQRHRARGERQRHDRRVGRIDLVVDRRLRQVGRQERGRGVDRGLHFLFRHVERQLEAELQRDDRRAARARRRHLVQARASARTGVPAAR